MPYLTAICIIAAGYLYYEYDERHDTSRFLKGLKGLVVFIISLALGVGIIIGHLI